MRIEVLVLAEIERRLPHLQAEASLYVWDCALPCSRKRPDALWVLREGDYAASLQLEIDESGLEHEDDDDRVVDIQAAAKTSMYRLVRLNTQPSNDANHFVRQKRLSNGDKVYQAVEPEFTQRMDVVCDTLQKAWSDTKQRVYTDDWKIKLFF